MGNVDVNLFFTPNLEAVRADVSRSYTQGGPSGYMLSSCNSVYPRPPVFIGLGLPYSCDSFSDVPLAMPKA